MFSNDLANLKYDKIRQFDAVYLNNTVGQIFVDPEVRDGLTRFVREGGGLTGNHGVSHASMDWPEFGEMIGVKWGVHREPTEQATIRIDDPKPADRGIRRQGIRVSGRVLPIPRGAVFARQAAGAAEHGRGKDGHESGPAVRKPCVRPDQDYAVSWIPATAKGGCSSPRWATRRVLRVGESQRFLLQGHSVRARRSRGGYDPERENRPALRPVRA